MVIHNSPMHPKKKSLIITKALFFVKNHLQQHYKDIWHLNGQLDCSF